MYLDLEKAEAFQSLGEMISCWLELNSQDLIEHLTYIGNWTEYRFHLSLTHFAHLLAG